MTAEAKRPACPTLNADRIPEYQAYEIARATFKALCRYFEQPGIQEKFEAWKAARDVERGCT